MKSTYVDYKYRVHCIRIETRNGYIFRFTDFPKNILIGESLYLADNGYSFTGVQASTEFSAALMDIEGIVTGEGLSRDRVMAGFFDSARLYVFATHWNAPAEDEEPIACGILGRTVLLDNRFKVELMTLIDLLSQNVGWTYTPSCVNVLGDNRCQVNLAALTVEDAITSVTNSTIFTASGLGQATDYFALGTIEFITGDNEGLGKKQIKAFTSGGVIELFEPLYYPPQVNDDFEIIPGCRKRLQQDCFTKYNNVLNFRGFPHVPTNSQYTQVGTR